MKTRMFLLLFLMGPLFGCVPEPPDIREMIIRQTVPLPKYYFYTDVVWPSDNEVAFVYYPKAQLSLIPNTLSTYDIYTKEIANVPMPPRTSACNEFDWWPGSLAVTPSGNLAFTTNCEPLKGPHLWMEYDLKTSQLKELFDYPSMSATHFSFISPDKVVQESAVGHPMSNELWMISLTSQTETRILPDFLRASHPTWSPQQKLIAFWGTEKFPGDEPGDLYTSNEISKLVRYPWDLYVMNENGERVQKILLLVAGARGLEWSPTGNLLAFAGKINDVEGIWLLNLDNPVPIRIFESSWLFTWSPDGKKLFVIQTKEPDETNNAMPVTAYILELPNCVLENNCT